MQCSSQEGLTSQRFVNAVLCATLKRVGGDTPEWLQAMAKHAAEQPTTLSPWFAEDAFTFLLEASRPRPSHFIVRLALLRGAGLMQAARSQAFVKHENAVAVVEGDAGSPVTYADLLWRSLRLSAALAGAGLQPGGRVAVLSPNAVAVMEAHFAAAAGRFTLVSLNTHLAAAELAYILADSQASVLIAHCSLRAVVMAAVEAGGASAALLRCIIWTGQATDAADADADASTKQAEKNEKKDTTIAMHEYEQLVCPCFHPLRPAEAGGPRRGLPLPEKSEMI